MLQTGQVLFRRLSVDFAGQRQAQRPRRGKEKVAHCCFHSIDLSEKTFAHTSYSDIVLAKIWASITSTFITEDQDHECANERPKTRPYSLEGEACYNLDCRPDENG